MRCCSLVLLFTLRIIHEYMLEMMFFPDDEQEAMDEDGDRTRGRDSERERQ